MKPVENPGTFSLTTPTHEQAVFVGNGKPLRQAFHSFTSELDFDEVIIMVDRTLRQQKTLVTEDYITQLRSIKPELSVIELEVNNLTKDFDFLGRLLIAMSEAGLTRKSLLVGIGGGSLLDAVGVAASIYQRGIRYMTVPTTFISMADGIISKVAVNLNAHKNVVGAFYSPIASFADTDFVKDLPFDNLLPGLVEVWKQSLITGNNEVADEVLNILGTAHPRENELTSLIGWSMRTKAHFITDDWRDERGIHKALSLGHTLANFLEMKLPIHHGEAVLYGIALETVISRSKGLLGEPAALRIQKAVRQFDLHFQKYDMIKPIMSEQLFGSLRKDKISHHGLIKFVLPTDDGYAVEVVTEEELAQATAELEGFISANSQ